MCLMRCRKCLTWTVVKVKWVKVSKREGMWEQDVKASMGLDSTTCTKGELVASTLKEQKSLVLLETTLSGLYKR